MVREFTDMLCFYVKKKINASYVLPKEQNEFNLLDLSSHRFGDFINESLNSSEFRFNLMDLDRDFLNFDEYIYYISNYTKSKSIRRELYQSADLGMGSNYFDWAYIFCYSFKDINIILFLLKRINILDSKLESIKLIDHKKLINKVIKNLKLYYQEKQIRNLILKDSFVDILWMFHEMEFYNNKYSFSNVKCNIDSIHKRLIEIKNQQQLEDYGNTRFKYSKYQTKKEVIMEKLYFKLPKDSLTLLNWGNKLENCLFAYSDVISSGYSTIYGVFKKKKLLYAVSINKTDILEASGKFNKDINEEDLEIINNWFRKYK